jgi:uncharacterized protein (TIGR03000 family)
MFTRVGVPAVVGAVLLMAGPAWAQHSGGGGHGGGFHSGGFHSGGFHSGGFHHGYSPGSYHGYYPYHRYYPGYYPFYRYYPSYGSYAPYSYYPSYDSGYDSAPNPGYLDSYGGVAPSYSSGDQVLEPLSTESPDSDSTAHVTVRVPADAKVWIDEAKTVSTGSVREFQSPTLTPGHRYSYEVRARWTENGHAVTQRQKVAFVAGAHTTVDFPVQSGTN